MMAAAATTTADDGETEETDVAETTPTPVSIPDDLAQKLNAAEALLVAAGRADAEHDAAAQALLSAQGAEQSTQQAALQAHRSASEAASDALQALREHFGLTTA